MVMACSPGCDGAQGWGICAGRLIDQPLSSFPGDEVWPSAGERLRLEYRAGGRFTGRRPGMRAYRFVWVAVLGVSVLMAAPRPQTPPVKDRKQLQADSKRFAQQIHAVIEQIALTYVRPVRRDDLVEAAITGLYQA